MISFPSCLLPCSTFDPSPNHNLNPSCDICCVSSTAIAAAIPSIFVALLLLLVLSVLFERYLPRLILLLRPSPAFILANLDNPELPSKVAASSAPVPPFPSSKKLEKKVMATSNASYDPRQAYERILNGALALKQQGFQGEAAVLVATGSFNPIHFDHVEMFEVAKKHLEKTSPNCRVIGGLISPSHDSYVSYKLGTEAIPAIHRVKMCELALTTHPWISVDGWECLVQQDFVDFPWVVTHHGDQVSHYLKDIISNIRMYFICGADLAVKCGLYFHGLTKVGTIAVGRHGYETEVLEKSRLHPQEFMFCETQLRALSSTLIRERIKEGKPINDLTFPQVVEYLKAHMRSSR